MAVVIPPQQNPIEKAIEETLIYLGEEYKNLYDKEKNKVMLVDINELGFAPLRNVVNNIIKQKSNRLGVAYSGYLRGHKQYAAEVLLPKLEYLRELMLAVNVARRMPYEEKIELRLSKATGQAAKDVQRVASQYHGQLLEGMGKEQLKIRAAEGEIVNRNYDNFGRTIGLAKDLLNSSENKKKQTLSKDTSDLKLSNKYRGLGGAKKSLKRKKSVKKSVKKSSIKKKKTVKRPRK
mgnify:CR=1 FL=1